MSAKLDELSVIEPLAVSVDFRGTAVSIRPLKVGQLPKFARAIKPISGGAFDAVLDGDVDGIVTLFADHGDALIDAISVASGLTIEQIEDADIDDLVKVAAVIVRVNADFFARRLTPALAEVAKQAAEVAATAKDKVKSGDGQTPSKP